MKKAEEGVLGVRAIISCAAQYITRHRDTQSQERIGQRIGSKITLLCNIERVLVSAPKSVWVKCIAQKILPALLIKPSAYGPGKNTDKYIVKIPKMWNATSAEHILPFIPSVIKRVFAGWGIEIDIDVQQDKSSFLLLI